METTSRNECVNEAKLLESLPEHPHVIKYFESFLHENELYLVLEYAEQGDFSILLNQARSLQRSLPEIKIWFFTVCSILIFCFIMICPGIILSKFRVL